MASVCSVAHVHMRSPWAHQCLSPAWPTCAHLTHNPNQALAEAPLRNQIRSKNICRKSGNFIELSTLYSRDIEKPGSRKNREGKRRTPIRRKGGFTRKGCQSHWSWEREDWASHPAVLSWYTHQHLLLLRLLKAREGTPG